MRRLVWLLFAATLFGAACTSESRGAGRPDPGATPSPSATAPAATASPAPQTPHPVSIQALIDHEFDGRNLVVGRVLARNAAYTRYAITYASGRLTISGIMNVPAGKGPFPVLILNHGHQDLDIYTTGRGLRREQDYLARRGYVVVHPDFRNHATSSDDPGNELRLRLGYTEDVVNAVLAVKAAKLPYIDPERIGMLGRSMGGGITLNVAVVRPDLVKAIVLFAPVSSNVVDNFNRWTVRRPELARQIVATYGSPHANPEFWRNVSPVTFFDRVQVPVQIHQGTADESVSPAWTQRTYEALLALGKPAQLFLYQGAPHEFGAPAWPTSMARTLAFFDQRLKP